MLHLLEKGASVIAVDRPGGVLARQGEGGLERMEKDLQQLSSTKGRLRSVEVDLTDAAATKCELRRVITEVGGSHGEELCMLTRLLY